MSDTLADANEARIAEIRQKRIDGLEKARAAKAARAEDAPDTPPDDAPPEHSQLEKVALNVEAARQAKIDALRRAKANIRHDGPAEKIVGARVTKKGDGKVSMGEHIAGLGDLTYDRNEIVRFPETIALALEERGWVEIED